MQFSSVVIGDESLLAECSNQLLARGHTIAAVVTNNPYLADWAHDNNLPVVSAGRGLADRLNSLHFDWILNIAGLRVLPPEVLALPARGAVNFHDGPLPQHAGLNAPVWALLAGEQQHGISWHMITETIDQGDILARAAFDITADDTALTLNAKCFAAGVESFANVLDMLERGQVSGQPQDMTGRDVHLRHDRPLHDGLLDFTRPAANWNAWFARWIMGHIGTRYARPNCGLARNLPVLAPRGWLTAKARPDRFLMWIPTV